jgi:hypothetical protein
LKRLLEEGIRLFQNNKTEESNDAIYCVVQDIAVALTGKSINFCEPDGSRYPNGVRVGENYVIAEEEIFENLPSPITSVDFDKGVIFEDEDF